MRNAIPRRSVVNFCELVLDVIRRDTPSCGTMVGNVGLKMNVLNWNVNWSVSNHGSRYRT